MPLSPPSLNISVLRAVQNNRELGLERSLQAAPGLSPLLPPFPVDKFSFLPDLYLNRCEGLCSTCSGAELPLTCGEGQPLFGVDVVVCDHTDQ